ncbi:MAG: basic amino acid ABC transporter substrate-binding protein [Solirubrobacterales bacterium]
MSGTRKRLSIAVVGLIAAFAIYGCGGGGDSTSSSTTVSGGGANDLGVLEPGTLTIGSDIPYPPFEQGKPPDYTGFDVELMDAIAKKLNLTPKWVDTAFGTIFADLQAGKFDIVASSTTITPARSQRVTFSDPYYDANQSLMVQKGSDLTTVDDITSDTAIGVQEGTTGQDYAENQTDGTVQAFAAIGTVFNALQAGQVDAVINDFSVSAYALKKYPELDVVQQIATGEHYGFPMQKSNSALIDAVNGALGEVIDDGTYGTIYKKWFQEEPPKAYQPSS